MSESTALKAITIDARTGRPERIKLLLASASGEILRPTARPTPRYTKTGTPIVPIAPSGSRRNTLSSIQVSFQSPRNLSILILLAYRVASQFDEDILEIRENRPEIRDTDLIL